MNTPLTQFRALMAQEASKNTGEPVSPQNPRSSPKQPSKRVTEAPGRRGRPPETAGQTMLDYHLRVPATLFLRLRAAGSAAVRAFLEKFTKEAV